MKRICPTCKSKLKKTQPIGETRCKTCNRRAALQTSQIKGTTAMEWRCPNDHCITRAVICGGDIPYINHGNNSSQASNVYFYMELNGEQEFTREVYSDIPFELTDEDWKDMHDHAAGGCCGEPQCPICLEYLEYLVGEN